MGGYIGRGQPVAAGGNSVETADIIDDAVTNAKIATDAVTGDSIASNAVGNSELSDDAVGVAELSATGTASSTTFLRGDNTWDVPIGGVTSVNSVTGAVTATHLKTALENGIDSVHYVDDSIDAAHLANSINTDIATGVTANTTANAALPKAGGTMTGDLNFGDNVDANFGASADLKIYHSGSHSLIQDSGTGNLIIQAADLTLGSISGETYATFADNGAASFYYDNSVKLATTSAGATVSGVLTTAGATLTNNINMAANDISGDDNFKVIMGNSQDLEIFHDGSHSYVHDTGTGDLYLRGTNVRIKSNSDNDDMAYFVENGAATLYYSNAAKIATSNTGVTVTGAAVGTMTTDNDGSFAMSASNNFKCTPSGSFTLTFTSIVAQSGNILLINSGGHTVSAHSNTKVDANLLATVSTAGTYLLAYFSDGTNVYMTNSAIYT